MEKNVRYLRQVIVVDKSLGMPTGKLAAMVAHAAMTFMVSRVKQIPDKITFDMGLCQLAFPATQDETRWLTELDPGIEMSRQVSMAKIVCAAKDNAHLLGIEAKAKEAGLVCNRVVDCGYAHNAKGTLACIAIGPDWPERLEPVTGDLKIYK